MTHIYRAILAAARTAWAAFRPRALVRPLGYAAALLLSLHGLAGAAAAQPSCTEDPCGGVGDVTLPLISFGPASGTYTQASIPVVITFSDGHTLDDASRVITHNGQTVTTAFQYGRTSVSPLRAQARGTTTLQPGANTLSATICDLSGNCRTSTATYAFGVPGVTVGPDGGTESVQAGTARTYAFTVTNTGPSSARFALRAVCRDADTGAPVACGVADSVAVAAGGTASVSVSYTAGGAGSRMSLELRARQTDAPAVEDAGWAEVEVFAGASSTPLAQALGVSLVDLNSGTAVSRDECVTVSVGAGAAYECGDLRLAHGVPGMATLGRARAPVLLYNSQHANPRPVVYADVTRPASAPAPSQVVATVTRANGTVYTRTFAGSDWQPGTTRRIGVQWSEVDHDWALVPYTLQVTAVYAGGVQHSTTVQGEMLLTRRAGSPFGAGWWLAGVESIGCYCVNGGSRLMHWSGDGSARMYEPVSPGGWTTWVAQNPDGRPDTLVLGGSVYRRKLPGGGEIHFDGNGRHVRTVSRLNDTTHFGYDAQTGQLTYVSVPGRDGVARGFRLAYTGGYLTAVTPEIAGAAQPGITLANSGGRVTSITDPDGLSTLFGYADAANPNRVTSRRSRDTTLVTYGYDGAGKLGTATLALSNTASIVTTFAAAESRGVNPGSTTLSSVALSQAYTLIDGPRTDVADQTRIWVTARGAPRRIRDAMGGQTVLSRTHPTYPSLVTEVRGTSARGDSLVVRSTATYDFRGRVATSTAVNPLGDGQNLTTTYAYDDVWDAPTSITTPGVGPTEMAYDPVTGNVLWQQQGGATRRVNFDYHTSGPHRGLLARVLHPDPVTGAAGGGGVDSLGYDPMGNLAFTRSPQPQRFLTHHYRDPFGRDTLTITPVRPDSADVEAELQGNGTRTRTGYDVMGRVAWTESVGRSVALPATSRVAARTAPAELVRVETTYDAMSRPRLVSRHSSPDSAGVGIINTFYGYDRAGRKVTEHTLGAGKDSTAYDPAGNAVAVVTARGHTITMQYDPLGRLVRRDVPAATDNQSCVPGGNCSNLRFPFYPSNGSGGFTAPAETFLYRFDAAGNQVYAENLDAKVSRTYYPGGALRTDTTRMRTYAGMEYTHVFGLEYRYDAVGRVRALQHPGNLTGTAQADSFAYHATTGALTQAWSRQGYRYDFEYDLLGRPVRTVYPGGTVRGAERTTYDEQGRRLTRIDSIPGGVLAQDAYTYDARGKTTFVSGSVGSEQTEFRNWYSGLGNLLGTDWGNPLSPDRTTEVYSVDGMGNQARSTSWGDGNGSPPTSRNAYQAGTGRITSIGRVLSAQPGETALPDSTYRHYDGVGNVTWGEYKGWGSYINGVGINHITLTRNYYGADQKLREVQVHDETQTGSSWSQNGSFAEYRYDPLGRRIMERTRRDSVCFNTSHDCESTLTRFVWAGDQLLWELRVPGGNNVVGTGLDATSAGTSEFYGRVSYFHAGGIDRPLLITKEGAESVVPRETWRGQFHRGTSPTTGAARDCAQGGQTGCLTIAWPGMQTNAAHSWGGEQPDIRVWYGGLVDGMRDASGQMYMRNRYYDPATGQFTQTDPIGVAGGLNAYGFAAGDPVSYSDPYGLCIPWPSCLFHGLRSASGRAQASLEDAAAEQFARGGLNTIAGVGLVMASTMTEFAVPNKGVSKHHIATDKNTVSNTRGGPWTPMFQGIFAGAGMSLQDPENLVDIAGHQGPHSEIYHRVVFDRLFTATDGLTGGEYREALIGELRQLRSELQTPGSDLNKMVTAGP